jgi:hypothetical protein
VDSLLKLIGGLLDSQSALARRAVAEYAPIVDSILRDQSRDVRRIEHTLDGLLDFCFDGEALVEYRKLCRHYFLIDPVASATYVHAYRDLWDSDQPHEVSQADEGRPPDDRK